MANVGEAPIPPTPPEPPTPVLPYDAQIEYLESTGTQWIDTGIFFLASPNNEEVNIQFEFTEINTSDNNVIFGAFDASGSKRLFTFVGSDKKWKTSYGSVISSNATASVGTEYTVRLYFRDGKQDLTVNGTDVINSSKGSLAIPTTVSQAIFCSKSNGAIISPSKMKLKSFNMSSNGVKVRDYIPVRVGQVGYLYDKVSEELFGNQGTDDFILGNDITT